MTTAKRIRQIETRLQVKTCRILSRPETERVLAGLNQEVLQQIPDNEVHGILTGRQVKAVLGAL